MATNQPIILRPNVSYGKKPTNQSSGLYLPGFSTDYAVLNSPRAQYDAPSVEIPRVTLPEISSPISQLPTPSSSIYSPVSSLIGNEVYGRSSEPASSVSFGGSSEYTPGSITSSKETTPEDYGGNYELQKVMKDAGVSPVLFDKVGMAVQQVMRLTGADPTVTNLVPLVSAAVSYLTGDQQPSDQARLGSRIEGALAATIAGTLDPTGISRAFIPAGLTLLNSGNTDAAIANALGTAVGIGANTLVPGLGGLGALASGLYSDLPKGDISANTINALLGGVLSSNPIGAGAYTLARNFLGFNPGQALSEMMSMYPDLAPGYEGGFFGRQGRGSGIDSAFAPTFEYIPGIGLSVSESNKTGTGLDFANPVEYTGTPWGMVNPEYSARDNYLGAFAAPVVSDYISPLSSIYDLATNKFDYGTGYDTGSGLSSLSYSPAFDYSLGSMPAYSGANFNDLLSGLQNDVLSSNAHSLVVLPKINEVISSQPTSNTPSYSNYNSTGSISGGTSVPVVQEYTPPPPSYNFAPSISGGFAPPPMVMGGGSFY